MNPAQSNESYALCESTVSNESTESTEFNEFN